MDMQVAKKKLSLKEKYKLMTRDLGWDTTYHTKDEVFPYVKYEGIKIHDWDKWEDPFRLTMDSYWKYQGEKERKFYAIIDAHAQNNGHLNITDASYLSALKIFLQAISPGEYAAGKGFARMGREFPGVGTQVACQMQSIDEIRHAQTQIHALSNYNKFYNGFHAFADARDRMWYCTLPRSFFDDALSAGPFEFMIAIGFSFEYVLTNLLFVPFMSGAAYNGDMATVTFGFSAQSDEARHMTLGLECIKFMLEQDPDNLPIVQGWIDKWFWRGFRLLGVVGTMMDYMLPKRVMSWKEAWGIYGVENGGALFRDLARYGIRPPKGWDDADKAIDHMSHQFMLALYQYNFGTAFHSWIPSEDDMAWLSKKYPDTFDKYYRPRWNHLTKLKEAGTPFANMGLAKLCQTCQIPTVFTEPDDPTSICQRETEYKGEKYHFCSDGCQHIFENEPEKYIQAWLPMQQLFQAPISGDLGAWMNWVSLIPGKDNGDYDGSEDQRNFEAWRKQATSNQ
ncbi:aromatic/alkene/methane monooxygenase hydroxylase/oxygenase subunit alpha [Dechloromonas sp. HYN0024]|uniref:aromatic/alkene/methane monooxygenase hydroxylase/oxygenase subunit alpha n=1 Tax=Dechloromonas sp. HYN0024 TaxID=2231055 RepID=UPI000E43095B|nr:aromatic/alkene/methane monooxygenase hydroxylase/oxygenase subunit alpha [Dechloromonas sp. HYN0024]AXS81064.1 YHS domain-containing protein [Dechloromonas sp. HYN0024]